MKQLVNTYSATYSSREAVIPGSNILQELNLTISTYYKNFTQPKVYLTKNKVPKSLWTCMLSPRRILYLHDMKNCQHLKCL